MLAMTGPASTVLPPQLMLPPAPAPWTPGWFVAQVQNSEHLYQAEVQKNKEQLSILLRNHDFLIGIESYSDNKIALNTARDIRLGQLLNEMKSLTKKLFIRWTDWAYENVNLGKRTREIVMRIARYKFNHKWHKLGKSRLDRVCAALEPHYHSEDDVNLIMDYLVKRCGEDVFDDKDPRLENEITGLYSACKMSTALGPKINNPKLLIAAANAGLSPTAATIAAYNTMTVQQVNDELLNVVETGSSMQASSSPVVRHVSTRRSDEIFDQLEEYYSLFKSGETTDTFDKVRAAKVVVMIQDMIAH